MYQSLIILLEFPFARYIFNDSPLLFSKWKTLLEIENLLTNIPVYSFML